MVDITKIECCTRGLYSAIEKDPEVLQNIDKIQFVHTPLHEAAETGNTSFAIEIMNLIPSFGKKLNPQGFSPLHLAIENKKTKTAISIATFDKQLVRVKGKDGLTPLHCAAKLPCDVDLLGSFLYICPDSINDLNNRFQTAVHIALESGNSDAFELLVNWLIKSAREPILAKKDRDENSAIHTAVQYGRLKEVKRLVTLVKLNKKNSKGETARDIALARHDGVEMVNLLKDAGAMKGNDIPGKEKPIEYLKSNRSLSELFFQAYYFIVADMNVDMRNVILVVAVLISTATYQGVLQPPGGVYQGSADSDMSSTAQANGGRISGRAARETAMPVFRQSSHPRRRLDGLHPVGEMVMEKQYYGYFMPANTFAFVLSTVIIIFVLPGRPFIIIIQFCLIFMCLSYLLALLFISGSNTTSKIIFILSWFAISYAFTFKVVFYLVKAVFDDDVWWLRRYGIVISNLSHRSNNDFVKWTSSFMRKMRRLHKLLNNNSEIH